MYDPKAVVTVKPEENMFREETLILRCDIQGGGDTEWTYSWTVESTNYWNKNTVNQYKKQEYKISSVEHTHSGKYICRGKTRDGQNSEISDAVTLTVSEIPKPTQTVKPQSSVFTGDTITLNCEVDQSTEWEFLWTKDSDFELFEATGTKTISSVKVSDGGQYECRARRRENIHVLTDYIEPLTVTVEERPKAKVIVQPHERVLVGETVTLRCDIQEGGDTSWQYSWYKDDSVIEYKLQEYTINSVTESNAGKYRCNRKEIGGSRYSHTSDEVTLRVLVCRNIQYMMTEYFSKSITRGQVYALCTGETVTLKCEIESHYSNWRYQWYKNSTAVSESERYTEMKTKSTNLFVIIITSLSSLHFTSDSLSLSCEDQSNSAGWSVRRYTDRWGLQDCSSIYWGSQTGSKCRISPVYTSHTGVYWCYSESGENSNPVNITVHYGGVILESPVHPVTEGDSLTLRCLYRYKNPSVLTADFYKDGSLLQKKTKGFYYCKHTERGESPKSWISVRAESQWKVQSSVLNMLSSLLAACPYLLLTVILLRLLKTNASMQRNFNSPPTGGSNVLMCSSSLQRRRRRIGETRVYSHVGDTQFRRN
ncbi:carcinoembryonic antigen-related cell adhesion molecule 5-like [Myxocyprinus asiaticus]|uniref:carcinoembryonic antigen-related cell adhesion molecule 5-like n=1 Tax=Myxocyprinus asiaticus TaxID=70543 RepID=UPI0022231175|nr:carcinoembryonic antigen-related cell adhesion molecule 5-like [Myxocyprinus asiaticus]